jgi:tetratricopeptide (TPR) repeat protein
MKKTLKLMLFAFLAFSMFACGEKKLNEEDLKKAEATLFNDDKTINPDLAAQTAEKFCRFVEQNPESPAAPSWLFKALSIYITTKDFAKSEEVCNKLVENYPDYSYTPTGMFMLANCIYDTEQHDLDKARAMYEKILKDYPDNEIVPSVEKSIEYLGMTPDEIMTKIQLSQMEVEEGVW